MQKFFHETHLRGNSNWTTNQHAIWRMKKKSNRRSNCILPRRGEVVKHFHAARCALRTASLPRLEASDSPQARQREQSRAAPPAHRFIRRDAPRCPVAHSISRNYRNALDSFHFARDATPFSCRDAARAGPVSALYGLMHRFIPPRERIERCSATRSFASVVSKRVKRGKPLLVWVAASPRRRQRLIGRIGRLFRESSIRRFT